MNPVGREAHSAQMDDLNAADAASSTVFARRVDFQSINSAEGASRDIPLTAPVRKESLLQKIKRVVKNFFNAVGKFFNGHLGINKKIRLSRTEHSRVVDTNLNRRKAPIRPSRELLRPNLPQDPDVAGPSTPSLQLSIPYDHAERNSGRVLVDKALALSDDVIDTLSLEGRVKCLLPIIPKVVTGAATFTNGTSNLIEMFKTYLGKLDAIRASTRPANRTSQEYDDPFLTLFDFSAIICAIRKIPRENRKEELEKILSQYLLEAEGDSDSKRAWLSGMLTDEAKAYIKPVIGWVVSSYISKRFDSFMTFMEISENAAKYGLHPKDIQANYTRVLKELTDHIRKRISSLFNQEGLTQLKPLLEPMVLINTVDEMINRNATQIVEKVIARVLEVTDKINFSTAISHNFSHLQERIRGHHTPMDEKATYDLGTDIVDLLFPIVDDKRTPLKRLWEDKFLPEVLVNIQFSSIIAPLFDLVDKATLGAITNMDPLDRAEMQERFEMRILLISQQLLSVGMSQLVRKAIKVLQEGTFIDSLLAEQVLPMVMDQVIVVFSKQVLSRNIDANFMLNCKALSLLETDEIPRDLLDELSLRWTILMNNQSLGFSAFEGLRGQDYGHAKFLAIILPEIAKLKEALCQARRAKIEANEEFEDGDMSESLKVFFNPPANPHHTPDLAEINAYNAFIKDILGRTELLSGKVSGLFANSVNALIDANTKEWIEAIPSTQEILTITLDSLREFWSTESDGAVSIDVDKVLNRILTDDEKAIMADQLLGDQQKTYQLEQLAKEQRQAKSAALKTRIAQMSALLTDFIEKSVKVAASDAVHDRWYNRWTWGLAEKTVAVTSSVLAYRIADPGSLDKAISKIYHDLLVGDESRRAIIFSIFRSVVNDAKAAEAPTVATLAATSYAQDAVAI